MATSHPARETPIDLPPGPRAPAVVQLAQWMRRPIPLMESCGRRYGKWFTLRLMRDQPLVFTSDPQAIREIFAEGGDDLRAGEANALLEPLLGPNSLLVLDGERHRRERKLLLPPFHGERMQGYAEAMHRLADERLAALPRDTVVPVHEHLQRLTLDVILRVVFGFVEQPVQDRYRELIGSVLEAAKSPLLLVPSVQRLMAWGVGSNLIRTMEALDVLLFEHFIAQREAGEGASESVLSMLVSARDEDGQRMRLVELRDEMMTLLVAGHETTATALAWCLGDIAAHEPVLLQIQGELERVMPDGFDAARVPELSYLDAAVRESLRLHPVLPVVARRLVVPMEIGSLRLPAGAIVAPCIYLVHRDPNLYPRPEQYLPERFLGSRLAPHQFFPFGGGNRRCLGMTFSLYEMKIILATWLLRVRVQPVARARPRVVRRSITLAPSGGMPLRFVERSA